MLTLFFFLSVDSLDPEKLIQCPYDKNHQIRACRFPYHLIKCRKVGYYFCNLPCDALLSSFKKPNLGFFFFLNPFFVCVFSRAAPTTYGGPQARGPIGAVATGLHHSHSHTRSEPHLRPTPQLTATPDP